MQMIGNSHSSEISLYFHIPFCTRKCDYCHFYVVPDNLSRQELLLNAFKLEWERNLPLIQGKKLVSIYFGGGTPSLFGSNRIHQVLQLILGSPLSLVDDVEITLEANPEKVNLPLMKEYALAGINRISLGIQTLDFELLQILSRQHSPQTAIQAVHTVFEAGISNISIDLMYDLPKQNLHHWEKTLDQIPQLPITHLSLYNLTIEPHTLFFKNQVKLTPLLPNEETSLAMYEMAVEKLESFGLPAYEISAFAKANYYSRHNTGYWTGRPFLGFGPSAFSYWEGKRFRNVANLNKYAEALKNDRSPVDFEEQLDIHAHRRELFVIQLRLKCGVDLAEFEKTNGVLDEETKHCINKLMNQNLLYNQHERLYLSPRGMLCYDSIASELI